MMLNTSSAVALGRAACCCGCCCCCCAAEQPADTTSKVDTRIPLQPRAIVAKKEAPLAPAVGLGLTAQSWQDDVSAGDCLCGWLETSLSAPTPAEEAACVRLKRLALLAVRTRRLRSLDKALAVFFPDCALRLTIQLLESLMTLEEPHLPAELMLNMMEALRNTTKQQDSELFIYDRHWLSTAVLSLLLSSLSTLLTSAGRARLLGLMIDARLVEMLVTEQAERPDLPLLLRLSTVLGPSAVRLDWLTALPPGGGAEQLRLEASRAVAALCTAGELERADRLALAAGVSPDPVVLTQVTSDLGEVADEDRVTFWRQCSGRFTEKQLSRTEAVAFFRKHAETAVSVSERYVCLKLAWDWLSPDRRADPDCDITALERGVWTAYTRARINGETVEEPEPSPTPSPTHQPLLYRRPLLASGRRPVQPALTPDQLTTVRAVLGQLVDEGHLRQALLVAEYFGATTPDLERMVRLLKLAELCSTPDARQPQSQSELSQLTELVAALRHGSEIGQRVLSCARAATDLQTTYQEVVVTREPLLLLSSVLTGDPAGVDRYRLAADLIHGLQLPDSQVTEVILAQVIAQVKAGVSELDPLLALCPDPVLLGNRLLDTAEDLASFPEADGYGDDCQVGLLVAAHSAHTARLNLQGIGDVMGRARQLVRRLLVKEDFRLMVSLLLGLGRYEEMAYVFELLLREDRLERLLTAGVSDGRLGAALRRHLIRHHPEDTARLRLVTGRFGHHAEAAADWQSRAEQLITSVLQSAPDEHCTETGQLRLREAMDCYRHAATFYRHAERLSSADASLCQAQLVALQISISSGALPLPEGVRPLLLRRSHQQLHTLLTETLPYRAARLVLRAYPERPADWSQLLYRQYLCLGRDEYLTEYLQAEGQLDHSVIAGILKRIRGSARQFSPSRLRRLTLAAAGPELQYRAASQLQLRDVIGALLDTAEAGWLRDTVWKTGGM
ncbi:Spatacsin [Amphibalanus amphitrite]|uniref:Spatacsin n=1 Tax=Amphibalanus amphitrite TaxID=1232801 RepID=A0A6A4VYV4_AMPAM|nr:Spatacsin [Amphibalanus amphitrite]